MSTLKEMAHEYKVAAAKLAMAIERHKKEGNLTPDELNSLRAALRDTRATAHLLSGYYDTPRQDELKARKRELTARKKYELELQERGEGDNFALFMVNEELLDVNAQLRAIVPAGKRVHFGRKGRASSSLDAYAQNSGDRQQFIKWARADVDDAAEEARAELRKMLHGGMKSVTGRQREILLLYADGLTETAIGAKLGVHKSTVCRTLKRAKKNVASVVETQQKVESLRDGNRLDMTDPGVVKLLMGALTTHQATCFYLYYAEWLTIRQIGGLLNVDHSTICRTIKRAVARLNDVLGGVVDILDNIEGMDDVLFVIYCGLSEKDDELPPAIRDILPRKSLGAHPGQSNKERCQSVVPEFQIRGNPGTRRGSVELDQHGYLYQELYEQYRNVSEQRAGKWSHPIARLLVKVFQTLSWPFKYWGRGVK